MAALPNDKNNDTGSTPLGSTRNDSSEDEDFDEVTSQFPLRSGERSDVTMTTTDAEDEEDPDPRMITRGAGSLRKFGSTAGAKGSTSGGLEAIHENVAMSSVDKVTLTMVKLGFDESLGFVDLPGLRERATTLKEIEEELEWTIEEPGKLPVFIGGRSDKLFGFEGKLDEVAVFDRALSAAEVAAQFKVSERVAPLRKDAQKGAGK